MANDEIRRVSVEHDDDGKPFFAPEQQDVAATPLEEIRDRELQNIGTKEPIHVASWRAGWDTAVQNITAQTVPVYGPVEGLMKALDILHGIDYTLQPELIKEAVGEAVEFLRGQYVQVPPEPAPPADEASFRAGYEQGRKHGEQRKLNESKAFNAGYERAAAIYKDRRDRAAARLEAMQHRAEKGMPWSEKEVAGVLDVLHGHKNGPEITAPNLGRAIEVDREERDRKAPMNPDLDDYSKPFSARRILHNILGVWSNRSKEYIRGEIQDARDAIDAGRYTDYPEKVEKLATGCGQNNNYDEGYRRGMIDGEKSGRHAQQCEDNHRLGRWLRAEDDRRQREIGDRRVKRTGVDDGPPELPDNGPEVRAARRGVLGAHGEQIRGLESEQRIQKQTQKLLADQQVHYEAVLKEQADAVRALGRRMDRHADTLEKAVKKAYNIHFEDVCRAGVGGSLAYLWEKLEERLSEQDTRIGGIEACHDGHQSAMDAFHRRLDEHKEMLEARFNAIASNAAAIGEVGNHAQRNENAIGGLVDSVGKLEGRADTQKAHWERTENKADSIKADVDRLRTEVGGASGRAETAVAVAREARRIASNHDGDAGVPGLGRDEVKPDGTVVRHEIAPDGSRVRPAGSEDVMDMIDAKGREANLPRPDRPLKQTAWDNAENPKQRRGGMATPAPKGAMPAAGPRGAADEEGR